MLHIINQAFRIGPRAWGTQFHPEVTEQIIRDWCAWDPATCMKIEVSVGEFLSKASVYLYVAKHFLRNFLNAAGMYADQDNHRTC
ncbi:MAG: hypothetical protein JJE30_18795 [Desulfuromonadales bacterium]|nr:hypothetical protein [Desulfuromonadales bacterium]